MSWCWPALFVPIAWFLYRKMWAAAAAILFIPWTMALIFPSLSKAPIGFGVAIALFAKSAYIFSARQTVKRIDRRYPDISPEERNAMIQRAGGVSIAGGIVGGLFYLALFGLVVLQRMAAQGT